MSELLVVGVGPGSGDFLTPRAQAAIKNADLVVVAARHRGLVPHGRFLILGEIEDTFGKIEKHLGRGNVALVVSGDPGLFSLLPLLKERFPAVPLRVIPGVSSVQALCASLGESWEGAKILSGHGRPLTPAILSATVRKHPTTILLCDKEHNPAWACRALLSHDLAGVQVAVGEHLSYPDECLSRGKPAELTGKNFAPLSVVRIFNPEAKLQALAPGLTDDQFHRSHIPMTKEEVRWLILCKLQLTPRALVWDVGAGTGSISVECARLCPGVEVYSVERDGEALDLIRRNKERFALQNLQIKEGTAPAVLAELPTPSHVFVGGSGGKLADIVGHIRKRGRGITVLISSVTLTTAAKAISLLKYPAFTDLDIVQLAVSRGKKVGGEYIMAAQNPVTLVRARTGGEV